MNARKPVSRSDGGKDGRRKDHRRTDIRDLELAGGVEGGMEAGSAGGPGQGDIERARDGRADR